MKFQTPEGNCYSPNEGKSVDAKKVSVIFSPVSITNLRRSQLNNECHIVWLKIMTIIKQLMDLIAIILAVGSAIGMLIYSKRQNGLPFSIAFFLLATVDFTTCYILMNRVLRFQKERQSHPGYLHIFKHLSALKWVFTIESLCSLIVSIVLAAEINVLSKYYDKHMIINLVTAALVFALLQIVHLAAFFLFQKR